MLLEINHLEKHYGQRKLLDIDNFVLYRGDKVAVVGNNGSGKTTLLRIINGDVAEDSGRVHARGSVQMISQFHDKEMGEADVSIAGRLGLITSKVHSGGEQTKARIAHAMSMQSDILLADEPTTNLDIKGITVLEHMLKQFHGGLLLVSHDRDLLANVCNQVLEIGKDKCTQYHCSYADYVAQKKLEETAHRAAYDKYTAEKKRLKQAAQAKTRQSAQTRKTPKRMGNSEARLHKMGGQRQKFKLDKAAKAAMTRLEQLETVEKPWEEKPIVFDVKARAVHNPVLVQVSDVSKAYDGRSVLEHCSFTVPNGKRTALIGANGAGKTTLIKMIMNSKEGVKTCANLKIGYFSQNISNLDDNKNILENAIAESIHSECFVRTILARLLFQRDEIGKKASVISGGEKVKLSLAKIILSDFNLLVLDEPTNYLDIASRTALEAVLSAYPSAVLFVSHDRAFLRAVADRVVSMKDKSVCTFEGGYTAFKEYKEETPF